MYYTSTILIAKARCSFKIQLSSILTFSRMIQIERQTDINVEKERKEGNVILSSMIVDIQLIKHL